MHVCMPYMDGSVHAYMYVCMYVCKQMSNILAMTHRISRQAYVTSIHFFIMFWAFTPEGDFPLMQHNVIPELKYAYAYVY